MKALRYIIPAMLFTAMIAGTTACKTDDEPNWDEPIPEPAPTPTPGGDDQPADDSNPIRFNELNGNKPQKYIELYNTSDADYVISGMTIVKNGDETVYVAPAGTTIAAHGYLTLNSDATDYSGGFTAGLSAKKSLKFELFDAAGASVDVFINPSQAKGNVWDETDPVFNGEASKEAYGRKPDGSGAWYMIALTPGASNNDAAVSTEIKW